MLDPKHKWWVTRYLIDENRGVLEMTCINLTFGSYLVSAVHSLWTMDEDVCIAAMFAVCVSRRRDVPC